MTRRRARALLEQHRDLIAHAVARQIRMAVPSYEAVEEIGLAGNVAVVLEAVGGLLAARDPATVARVMDLLRALHQRRGFAVGDFMVAVLCALPVLRRFYGKYADTPQLGQELFERVEGVLIPLYGKLVALLADAPGADEPAAAAAPEPPDALPYAQVSLRELTQLKGEQAQIRAERDHLARELEAMQRAVESVPRAR